MIHTSCKARTTRLGRFNPLNRGGVIHTIRSAEQYISSGDGFNPLNRGGVIHTLIQSSTHTLRCCWRFNPLNRGGVIHTLTLWRMKYILDTVSILLIEAG